ncbi:MAG TPA: Npt1/Npt2 family nucleotide transporter [Candidatus Berkiella sp.]|nr:Npt1/Npt2 family nucleotide transporter [Candidatus Berkiella sp.]
MHIDPPKSALAKLRMFLWPIYGREHLKFVPMTLMISLILFNYTVLRNMKDTLVITATEGSEVIVFLKSWGVLPSAILFFFIYSKLSNLLKRQTLFYVTVSFFLLYFAMFALILYPQQNILHPHQSADWLITHLPAGLKSFVNMYKYWSFSIFYILAELWGSVVSALLFWQLANSIVKVSEAKRFYAHFYLLANLATAFSGIVSAHFSKKGMNIEDPILSYGVTVNYLVWTIVGCGLVVMLLYYYLDKYVIPDPTLVDPSESVPMKKKLKMGMKDSIKFILHNKYLGWIALLVICYGISINLVEVAWKNQVGLFLPNPSAKQEFFGMYSTISGLSTVAVILIGGGLMRWLGWKVAALLTPIVIGVTGSLFFYFMIFDKSAAVLVTGLGTTALAFAVYMGALQVILSKSTKYALFDPTKEMTYIPLDEESKVKGKAAVDVVGGRLGKAGGAFLQQAMLIFIGPMAVIAPYSAIAMIIFVLVWIVAVFKLHTLFVQAGGEKAWNE